MKEMAGNIISEYSYIYRMLYTKGRRMLNDMKIAIYIKGLRV